MDLLTPDETLALLRRSPSGFIDVRSEGEFEQGGVPGFENRPILSNTQRHEVGLTYRLGGRDEAIALGHRLVDPERTERVRAWRDVGRVSPHGFAIVACWRGGLRSEIAANWLREAGETARRVEGGYQALRKLLLDVLQAPPPLVVLSGYTGTGKTALLRDVSVPKIDLEALCRHRGSAFGYHASGQPPQAWFENSLALAWKAGVTSLVEDESATLGRLFLPPVLKEAMRRSPVVVLEATLGERIARVFDEYVKEPLDGGQAPAEVLAQLDGCLMRVQRRLGPVQTARIRGELSAAFGGREWAGREAHAGWIGALLVEYYDKAYAHAFASQSREILFRGNYGECRDWLKQSTIAKQEAR